MGTQDTPGEIERRYRSLVEHSLQGIAILQQNRFVYVNRAYADIFGYSPEDMLAMSPYEGGALIHPEDRPRVAQQYFNRQKGLAAPNRYGFRAFRRDGSLVHLETFISVTEYEGRPAVQTVVVDVSDLKRSEEALREVEERFRALAESTSAGIFIYQGEKTAYVNPAVSSLTDYTEEELLAMPFWTTIHPDQRETVKERGMRRLGGGDIPPRYEVKILKKGGETRWLEFSARLLEHGGEPAVLGTVFDVTDRKKAEEALRQSEAKYKDLVEQSIQGLIILKGVPPRLVFVNQAVSEITGYSREELLALPSEKIPSLLDLKDAQAAFAKYPRRAAGEIGSERYELQVFRKDGSRLWLEAHVSPIEYEGGPAVQAAIIDISGRRRAENALRESEERYRELVELSPDPVVILQDGRYKFVNAAFNRVFGYTRENVEEGLSFFQLVQEKDKKGVQERYEERLAGKELPRTYTLDLLAKDGTIVPTETSASLIHSDGRPADLVILRDISERVKAEEERRRLETQIQQAQKMESLGILAGGIAHDFNNLLTGVLGNADLALADMAPENPARSYLQNIFASAKHLADLTRQMLAYSGRGRFIVEAIRLNRLVEEMAHLLKVSISKKTTLRLDLSDEVGPVMADASQIRQVILNLIVNASEALGGEGGVISLRTGVVEADAEYLSETYIDEGLEPGRYALLSVSDSGVGMDGETLSRIFDPFFTTKFTGRGLGLAAVMGIVRGHGGAIKVYSEPGQGTTFRVLLPIDEELAPGTGEPFPAAATAGPGSGTILVVDDETTVRAIMERMLKNAGYDVLTASNGSEALSMLDEDGDGVSAVLLDLTMPQMSGEETYRAIRRTRPVLPVVLMSGFDEGDVMERFEGETIAGFIQKPFELKTIVETLRNILAES